MTDVAGIKWKRGEFIKFYALMKIRVGAADPKSVPIDIMEGDEFEYDGSLLKYGGSEMHSPQLRGAIKNNWVTTDPDEIGVTRVAAVQPVRNVAKSQTINRDLARVQRGDREPMETDSLDEETVLQVSDRRPGSATNPRAVPRKLEAQHNRRASTAGMRVENYQGDEDQAGVVVGRVNSPAKIKVDNMLDSRSHGIARDLENRPVGRPELYHSEGVTVKTNLGKVDRNVQIAQEDDGEVIGHVRHSKAVSTDGIEVKDTSNIRNKPIPPVQKAHTIKIDTKLSPKIRTARRIDPSFPGDWSFTGKLKDRLAAIKEHGESPEFLEALYAAEGDQMRKQLEKAYPKQFASD
jgi:hypothetical protein